MNKKVNLIIGSGVLGAYLSAELLKKNEKIIVTSRTLNKKFTNYEYLKIQKKVNFEKLNTNNKKEINLSKEYIDENNDNKFKLMERIFHQKFGYGKILEIDGDKVTIDFEKAGEKKLMLTFIEKI